MIIAASATVTVFGGTGFLGRRVVRHLADHGLNVRVASRHPEQGRRLFPGDTEKISNVEADVDDGQSVARALASSFAAVNAVSLYVEGGGRTFHSVHVEAAARVAEEARKADVARLVHVSGIGSNPNSASKYIRSRGLGEIAVRKEFPTVALVRPAVMFGPDDSFIAPISKMLRTLPAFPMFGRGQTKLQPVFVEDVAEAIARIVKAPEHEPVYELGGACVLSYEALLERLREHMGRRTTLLPVPFSVWFALAALTEWLPRPPFTRNQVELMREDNVVWGGPGFRDLGIEPAGVDVSFTGNSPGSPRAPNKP